MSNALSIEEIDEKLKTLSGWSFENDRIRKEFRFDNFREAMGFILRISYEAEQADHHPELFNCFNRVEISLNTHDSGGKVTEKDFSLAEAIEKAL